MKEWIFTRERKEKKVMKTCFSEENLIKQFGTTPTTPP